MYINDLIRGMPRWEDGHMSHVPSLEPRGPQPRTNSTLVGGATVFFLWGVLRLALSALDLFGRGEAAVDIYKLLPNLLQFLGHPAFSAVALVLGFAVLIWQAKDSKPASPKQLVHPITKLPVRSKPQIWPKIKRPVWTCVIAVAIAVPVWACYRTPLHSFIFVNKMPETAIPTPPPPAIELSAPKENPPKDRAGPVAPPVKMPMAPEKPTVAPARPTQAVAPQPQNRPTNSAPIPASAPLACPSPGTLAQGWSIGLQQMMPGNGAAGGLPIENGPISFVAQSASVGPFGQSTILHPLLIGKIHMPNGTLRGALFEEAESLFSDLKSQVGSPEALPYRTVEKPERFISGVERQFQNPQAVTVRYADGTRGSSDAIKSGTQSVPVASLSQRSQEFISQLDAKAKTDTDQACKDALKNLTQDE